MNNTETIRLFDMTQADKIRQISELDCNANLIDEIAEHYKPSDDNMSSDKVQKNVFYTFESSTVNEFRYLIKPKKEKDEPSKMIYTHNVFGRTNKNLINTKEISFFQDEIIIKKLNHEKNVKYTYEYSFNENGKITKARRSYGNITPSTIKSSQTEVFDAIKQV